MLDDFYIGSYWPGRIEPLESYARRAEVFFRLLAPLDPCLTQWFEQANSRAKALKSQFIPDERTLQGFLQKKKYTLKPGWVSFAAWNGEAADSAVVDFSCGSPSPRVVDLCLLTPSGRGPAAERILTVHALTQVLRAMVTTWEPEWGIAVSNAYRDEVLKLQRVGTFVGWITYFSHQRGTLPPLPAPVRVEPVEDKGSLVILTPERFMASNPDHVALGAQVQELLDRAGLLKPLQPVEPGPGRG